MLHSNIDLFLKMTFPLFTWHTQIILMCVWRKLPFPNIWPATTGSIWWTVPAFTVSNSIECISTSNSCMVSDMVFGLFRSSVGRGPGEGTGVQCWGCRGTTIVKCTQLTWFGHVVPGNEILANMVLQEAQMAVEQASLKERHKCHMPHVALHTFLCGTWKVFRSKEYNKKYTFVALRTIFTNSLWHMSQNNWGRPLL